VPGFEGLDAHNEMFRLERYLGRHRVLVVFFSAVDTAAADPQLLAIREVFPELERRDVKVVGISTALPQQNRAAMEHAGEHPFPLVTDVDLTIHRRWGRLSAATNEPLSGTFLVDRKGSASALGDQPRPVENLAAVLKELTE
jgi:peroxiredoxin